MNISISRDRNFWSIRMMRDLRFYDPLIPSISSEHDFYRTCAESDGSRWMWKLKQSV